MGLDARLTPNGLTRWPCRSDAGAWATFSPVVALQRASRRAGAAGLPAPGASAKMTARTRGPHVTLTLYRTRLVYTKACSHRHREKCTCTCVQNHQVLGSPTWQHTPHVRVRVFDVGALGGRAGRSPAPNITTWTTVNARAAGEHGYPRTVAERPPGRAAARRRHRRLASVPPR